MSLLAAPKKKQKLGIDPNNTNWANDSSALGQNLLKKMGWKEGKGLGANEDGRTVPVKASLKIDNKGLGCTAKDADSWIAHREEFDEILKSLNAETNSDNVSAGDPPKEKAEDGMKRFYGRFSRGGTKTLRTTEDLDCILGRRSSVVKTSEVKTEESISSSGGEGDDVNKSHGIITKTNTCSVQDYFAQKMKNRNLPSHLKAIAVKEKIEADTDQEKEKFSNGFVTSTCTVQAYFAQKMRAKNISQSMNTMAQNCESSPNCESSTEKQELPVAKEKENDAVLSHEETKTNIDSDNDCDETYKRKKKKRKENSENIEANTEKVNMTKKQKKKDKKGVKEVNSITTNFSGTENEMVNGILSDEDVKNAEKDKVGKKRKKKSKSKTKDDKSKSGSEDNLTESSSTEIVKRTKKRKLSNDKEDKDQEMDLLSENDEVKKKHKTECIDGLVSSTNSSQVEVEGKKRKRKKKSKTDQSNDITEDKVFEVEDTKDVEEAGLERKRKKRKKDDDKIEKVLLCEGDGKEDIESKDESEEKENKGNETENRKKKKSKRKKNCVEDDAQQDERNENDIETQIENVEGDTGGEHGDGDCKFSGHSNGVESDYNETDVSGKGKNSKKKLRYKMKQNLLRKLKELKDVARERAWEERMKSVGHRASSSMKQGQPGNERNQIRACLIKKANLQKAENSSSDDMAKIPQLDEEINKCKQSMIEKTLETKNKAVLELKTLKASIVKSIKHKGRKNISIINNMAAEHQSNSKIELNWQEEIGNVENVIKSIIAEVKKTKEGIVKQLEVDYADHTKMVDDLEQSVTMKLEKGIDLCSMFPGANVVQGYIYG